MGEAEVGWSLTLESRLLPGPSLALDPGPFPEMPGREKMEGEEVALGHQFTQLLET